MTTKGARNWAEPRPSGQTTTITMTDGETSRRGSRVVERHRPRRRTTAAAFYLAKYFPYPSSARSWTVLASSVALAAMSHLPTAVMYVMDLSGGAGDKCSSVEDQLILRRELRARFPRRPWIDVVSKVDLGIVDGARERLVRILEAEGRDQSDWHFIELSIKEGAGVEELRQEVMRMLGEVRVVLDAMAASDERSARAV